MSGFRELFQSAVQRHDRRGGAPTSTTPVPRAIRVNLSARRARDGPTTSTCTSSRRCFRPRSSSPNLEGLSFVSTDESLRRPVPVEGGTRALERSATDEAPRMPRRGVQAPGDSAARGPPALQADPDRQRLGGRVAAVAARGGAAEAVRVAARLTTEYDAGATLAAELRRSRRRRIRNVRKVSV